MSKNSQIETKRILPLVLFIFLLFSSPWFLILWQNHSLINLKNEKKLFFRNQTFVEEINTLRGEGKSAANPLLTRVLINKVTFWAGEAADRYLESFDPHYLFFGGIDLKTGDTTTGQFHILFLPLIILGIYEILVSKNNRSRRYFFTALLITPLPSIFFLSHYEGASKIFLFLLLLISATYGALRLFRSSKILAVIISLLFLFETVRFYHNFKVHHPRKLIEQLYAIKTK